MAKTGVANLVNIENGKKYTIRSGVDLNERIKKVKAHLRNGTGDLSSSLRKDYDKYGPMSFRVEYVEFAYDNNQINRIARAEIKKNGSKSYNGNTGDVPLGDRRSLKKSYEIDDALLDILHKNIEKYDLDPSVEEIIVPLIQYGNLGPNGVHTEVKKIARSNLFKIVNDSKISSDDKTELISKIKKGIILTEKDLKNKINGIIAIEEFNNGRNLQKDNAADQKTKDSTKTIQNLANNDSITSDNGTIRKIKEENDVEKLLNILNKSNLKSKDNKDLEEKINNKVITSEYALENEIKSILKSYKSNSNDKKIPKTSNKNNSLKNKNKKPKKHTWEQYNKTHNTKPKTFQDKISSNYIKLERQPAPLVDKCPVCSNRISKKDIYCAECGHQLKDNSYSSRNTNPIIAKLFKTEDNSGNLRYSVSKTLGFVILMFFVIADIIVLLFGIPSTKLSNVALITFGGLFYYVLFRLAGIIYRKLSK